MNKIVLIYNGTLAPKGGQSGYLYNLRNQKKVHIISRNSEKKEVKKGLLKKYLPSFLFNQIRNLHAFFSERVEYRDYINLYSENLGVIKRSKIVHFHETKALYYFFKYNASLAREKIILLTSHNPAPTYKEVENNCLDNKMNKSIVKILVGRQYSKDVFSFKNADYIVFPNKGSTSPYDAFFKENNININHRFKYLITGTEEIYPKISREIYREKLNIPSDKLLVGYIGRKIDIKGYDLFCGLHDYFKDNSKIHFISAGTGPIECKHMQSIGWTDDPSSFVNALDILIVPNKNTYFDLGVIQALSIGTNVLTTNTGGNVWFEKKGILHLSEPDLNSLAHHLEVLINEKNTMLRKEVVKGEFKKYFDVNLFSENYVRMCTEIIEDNS
jgi:hypothetical protein